ncbi:MAG: serine/threonine protein kinase, partial [Flavisolibacter sp.]|nr:serine/threonine protein kinase [Flavisolibacter sp.]
DVYSYGVILYELLAGRVPFPLQDRSETARNLVMLSHIETPPPDVLELRKKNIPASWSPERREHELNVPQWLVEMIYRCLAKQPQQRFANGMELQEYVLHHSTSKAAVNRIEESSENLQTLRIERDQLLRERDKLHVRLKEREAELLALKYKTAPQPEQKRKAASSPVLRNFLFAAVLIAGVAVLFLFTRNKISSQAKPVTNKPLATQPVKQRSVIGQYKVLAARAYFHNQPDEATRRTAYLIPSNDVVTAYDEKNGFIYTEFTNSRGQTSKGWVRKQDLISLEDWSQNKRTQLAARPTEQDINDQLQEARNLLADNKTNEALYIYSYLAEQEVPEAMYHYGNLTLHDKNNNIDCKEALKLVTKAADKGFIPAKRTLGFLYLFAKNEDVLRISNYNHCTYEKNVLRGTKLLMEAVVAGDTTAKRIMDEVNVKKGEESGVQ